MRATEIRFQFQSEPWRTIQFKSDLSSKSIAALRKLLISQCAPTEDPSPANWIFYVNDEVQTPLDAANRKIGNGVLECRLISKNNAPRVVVKRTREDPSVFNLQNKLVRILREDMQNFKSERESNGLCHRNVIAIIGHISKGITSPVERVVFNTDDIVNPIIWVRAQQANSNIAICAYFVPYHVSLLCAYGNNRVLHLDPSHSFHPKNQHLFDAKMPAISYTYVPFQMYDETNQDVNLAGGNCAMFAGLNAIGCVLRYRTSAVRFAEFWKAFIEVCNQTPVEKAIFMKRACLRNIIYYVAGMENIVDSSHCPMPPIELAENPGAYLPGLENMDFTSDFIMLSYFRDTNLGFHQVALRGNVFRFLLQEIVQRGFISSRLQMLCGACDQIADSKCSQCDAVYCSRQCMTHMDNCLL